MLVFLSDGRLGKVSSDLLCVALVVALSLVVLGNVRHVFVCVCLEWV